MQVENEHNLTERCLQYLCKLYSNQLNASETYTSIKKSILIAITTFDYYDRDEYHSIAHLRFEPEEEKILENAEQKEKKKTQQELVTDKLEYHVINLKRFKEEKAYKIIEELSQDPETAELYRLIQKGKIEENSTREFERNEGKKEGEHNKSIEIAKKMLKEKMDIEIISKMTGLTKNEIEKLK